MSKKYNIDQGDANSDDLQTYGYNIKNINRSTKKKITPGRIKTDSVPILLVAQDWLNYAYKNAIL